jgi:hypothetical protein
MPPKKEHRFAMSVRTGRDAEGGGEVAEHQPPPRLDGKTAALAKEQALEEKAGEAAPPGRDPLPPPVPDYDAVVLLEPETVETEWGPAEALPGQWKVTPRDGGKPFLVHADDVERYFALRPAE